MTNSITQEEPLLGYDRFTSKRDALVSIGEEIRDVFDRLSVTSLRDMLENAKERLRNEHFRLLVIGEFNSGKSTLINALLGKEILPSWAVETTAVINEIKWGPSPAARVHFKGGGSEDVSVTELEKYVALPPETSDPKESMRDSAYSKVEIFWPLDICRNGVEIIDSPGLNAHELREKITLDYLSLVDAIIFVLDCTRLGGMNELRVIDTLIRPAGYEDIFFVGNKINMLLRPSDIDRVKNVAYAKLGVRTKRGPQRVFFVNALGALEGSVNNDLDQIEKSGIRQLERDLDEFLTTDRARTKLMRSALEFSNGARQARQLVPQQINLLKMDLTTFENRQRSVEIPLRELEEKRRALMGHVLARIVSLKQEAIESAQEQFREVTNQIPTWASVHELENKVTIGLSKAKAEAQIEAASTEVAVILNERAEESFATWQTNVLQPMLRERVTSLIGDFKGETERFGASAEQLRTEMSFGAISASAAERTDKPPSTLDRVLSALGALLLVDVGLAVTGATFGFKEVLRNALPQIAIAAVGFWVVGLGGYVAIPVLAYSWYSARKKIGEINDGIKKAVADQFVEHLTNHSSEKAEAVGESVFQSLIVIRDTWDKGFETEIATIRQQLEAVRFEREKGEAAVNDKTFELEALREQMETIGGKLDDFVAEFAA